MEKNYLIIHFESPKKTTVLMVILMISKAWSWSPQIHMNKKQTPKEKYLRIRAQIGMNVYAISFVIYTEQHVWCYVKQ